MEADVLKMEDSFSFIRFKSYFTLYVIANRRKLMLGSLQIFIFTFLLTLFFLFTGGFESYRITAEYMNQHGISGIESASDLTVQEAVADPFWATESIIIILMAFIFIAYAGSLMFSSMINKKDRLSTIETPASQGEKFLVWWSIYLPLALVMILFGFWLADMIRVLWVSVFTSYGKFAHPYPFVNILSLSAPHEYLASDTSNGITFVIYSSLALCNAVFALGSIFFHRLNFLKTVVSLFVMLVVFAILFSFGKTLLLGDNYGVLTSRFSFSSTSNAFVAGSIIFLIAFMIYMFAYFRYREEEIICRW